MMEITIQIDTDDAAIDQDFEFEVRRLLRIAAEKIARDAYVNGEEMNFKLYDGNGNAVGSVRVEL